MNKYFNDNFYPRNFILIGSDADDLKLKAETIVGEAVERFPNEFAGNKPFFPFELRYVPPFESSFRELKRLQGTVATNAGYRSEYKGYIIFDLKPYIGHDKEHYFDVSVKFLADNNDCWSYIFVVDNGNSKAAADMIAKILGKIYCKVLPQEEKNGAAEKKYIQRICRECGVSCSEAVSDFLTEAIREKKLPREVARTVIAELAAERGAGTVADMKAVTEYLNKSVSAVRYMLSDRQVSEICAMLKDHAKGDEYRK